MIFTAHASRTMAHAVPVHDAGLCLRQPYRRARLIELSRRYIDEQEARQRIADQAETAIRGVIERAKRKHRRTRHIIDETRTHHEVMIAMVAAWHGVSVEDIMRSDRRSHPIILARRDAVIAVWQNCLIESKKPTTVSMGRAFRVDHTSIVHALRKRGLR